MKIMKLLAEKAELRGEVPSPVIAFLGDSITQGCFGVLLNQDGNVDTEFDQNSAYSSYIGKMLALLYPDAPVYILNADVSGDNSVNGNKRLERDVLRFRPDLTVVCFGLNDSCGGVSCVEEYTEALKSIFTRLKESGSEVIFMTPNMMNTYVSNCLKEPQLAEVAERTQMVQNDGILSSFLEAAKSTARDCGVSVCDVYSKWEKMQECGVDTTALLANLINHPNRQMNWLFAYSLVETMIND